MNRSFGGFLGLIGAVMVCTQVTYAADPVLPAVPFNPSPYSTSTNISTVRVLGWTGGRSTSYDIYFGTTAAPAKVANVKLPVYAPLGLKPSTKYFWKVVAKNAYGSTSSPVWVFTTVALPTVQPPKVDCVMSSWLMASATPWGVCTASGTQTRTEVWTRTVTVQPSGGGAACGPTTETRTATRSCTVSPAPTPSQPPPSAPPSGPTSTLRRLTQADLVYDGAFKVPQGSGSTTYSYGGTALTYHPGHDSLLMVGHGSYQQVGEFSIPAPSHGANLTDLPRAAVKQPLTDVLQGKRKTIDGDTQNGVRIGGLVVLPSSLVVTAYSYYDAGMNKQTRSHFVTGQNFASLGSVTGPFQVGTGFQNIVPTDTQRIAGFVSGYMTAIPNDWQSVFGGTHLTGQGGRIAIVTRTSSGPSASVFTPSELGVPNSAPTTVVMGYPSDTNSPNSGLHHPAIGTWGVDGGLYNGTQGFGGMVFPDGTRSVLFFGWGGSKFCYGQGTADPALHLKPMPTAPSVHYCYDPTPAGIQSKGTHAYPTVPLVFAYDANDLALVKAGVKKPWEVVPYATWNFVLPFQSKLVNGVETGSFEILGAAYDPAGRRIFLSAGNSEGMAPVVHVFRVP